uniref:Uncharacterized protein n=1 Tax=Tanacetum cinerariifolium TaxID=118510 RepID=A0A6L2MXE4_TANCI|nr:hypothetical protein [Tanacetum cinerariifolium]
MSILSPPTSAVRNKVGKGNEQILKPEQAPVRRSPSEREKLKEVKACLNFEGCSRRNSKIQKVSQHFESRTPNVRGEHGRGRRSRRSRSMSRSPEPTSIFSRIRRGRSESPRHRLEGKERKEGGVFNRMRECSSCGALYTTDYCCSEGSFRDKIIYDLDKTPDLSQRSPQNCPKCGNPVDGHYCQRCALLRKKFKEDLNGAHFGYNCPPKVLIIPNPEPLNNQIVKELPPAVPSFDSACYSEDGNSFTYDSPSNLVHDSPTVFNPLLTRYWKIFACYDDDDDDYTIVITHNEPDNSLSMGDEHLDTIPATKSDEFIKSSVENLVPNPSESKGEYECDVPVCEVFTTFSNILFDADYDFYSSDDQSFFDEDILKKIYSNPLFDEEIISMKIDPRHFNAESDLIESLLNHDSSIISSSSKIDSLFDEFAGELTLLKSISPGINENDCDPEEETRFIKRLLYDNSSLRLLEEFIFENSDTAIESFSPSPIPVEDSDSLMEEINLSFTPVDPIPLGIEEDDYVFERDILILEELLSNDSLSLPENESFHFDIPSSSCPPANPPNCNTGILNVIVMGDISKQKVPMPRLMFT